MRLYLFKERVESAQRWTWTFKTWIQEAKTEHYSKKNGKWRRWIRILPPWTVSSFKKEFIRLAKRNYSVSLHEIIAKEEFEHFQCNQWIYSSQRWKPEKSTKCRAPKIDENDLLVLSFAHFFSIFVGRFFKIDKKNSANQFWFLSPHKMIPEITRPENPGKQELIFKQNVDFRQLNSRSHQ